MILDLGLIDYQDALKLQRELVGKRRFNEISDSALIVEHPAVFTIGRNGSRDNLLVEEGFLTKKGIRVIDTDRGGDITFHGPGQLVLYPVIDLKRRVKDLHRYLRDLEEVAILFLKRYGIKGERVKDATGVWVDQRKIAFIGVAAKDWVTYHGLSVNIDVDTRFFSMMNPCGTKDMKVTSLKEVLGRTVSMYEAKKALLRELERVFGISHPPWIKKRLTVSSVFFETKKAIADYSVNTVCESAMCPNISECFSAKKATFMILGKNCTRACKFCSVEKGEPGRVDPKEPERIAGCVRRMGLKYVIITSVTRDDLEDGGAGQFVRSSEAIRNISEDIVIELLIPDLAGDKRSIKTVTQERADVIGHNIETVKRLYPQVRPGADYYRSLNVLKEIKELDPDQLTKSALIAGMGETEEDLIKTMQDLRAAGCDILTIGQYLRPGEGNYPVKKFVAPEEFEKYKHIGEDLGFRSVSSGPFVRSSYRAEEEYKKIKEEIYGERYAAAIG